MTPGPRCEDLDEQLTLDELAVLAEFDGDGDAIARLTLAASCGTLEHEAELLRQARTEQAEHDRIRAELESAGFAVTEILPPNGQHLSVLCHDGEDLTPESHAACPGRGRVLPLLRPAHPGALLRQSRPVRAQRSGTGDQERPAAAGGTAGAPASRATARPIRAMPIPAAVW